MEPVVWEVTPYTILLLAAAAILISTALYVRSRRGVLPASRIGFLVLLAGAEWMLCSALAQASIGPLMKLFWAKMQFVGLVMMPTTWLAYTLHYTGHEKWITHGIFGLLAIVPLGTLLMVFTNEAHGLIWSRFVVDTSGPFSTSYKTYGAGFWAFTAHSYLLLIFAISLVIHMLLRSRHRYHWQAGVLLLATLVPGLGNTLDLLRASPFSQLHFTAAGLAVTGPMVAWSLRRLRRGEMVPVAREVTLEAMSDVVIVLDQQDRVVDLNIRAEKVIGHLLAEAIGQPLEKVWADWPQLIRVTGDRAEVGREVLLGSPGRQRAYDMRISPIADWRGHITGRVIVLRDITERKQAEEKTRRRTRELATLNSIAMNVISTLDLTQVFGTIQEGVLRLLDVQYAPLFTVFNEEDQAFEIVSTDYEQPVLDRAAELVGIRIEELTAPLSALNPAMQRALLAKQPFVTTDGSDLVQSVAYKPFIRSAQTAMQVKSIAHFPLWVKGELVGSMFVLFPKEQPSAEEMEILSAIASQAAIAIDNTRLFEELKTSLRERDRAEAQLIQSAKLSAIGQMISGVAHELNNPLTTVMGYAQLLLAADTPPDVKQDLENIYNDAVRAHRIVENLLTFARQKKPQRGLVDINDIIERTLALRGYQLKVDNVEVVTELDRNLPWTVADSSQLQQVFLNIINNAHDAMLKGKGRGVLTVGTELVDGETIRVAFTDTGPGIPPEVLDKIFDPFFTTKEVGTGTGLGLSVSHGIVQQHEGRIWVESEPGQGATFFVQLPVKSWIEDVAEAPTPEEKQTPREGQRILVIDDERTIVDLMVQVLEDTGYQVDGVMRADLALERLRHQRYDLIISDIKMPGMDGPACIEEVETMDPTLAERIIFVTGDVLRPATQQFLDSWEGPYIEKPFRVDDLKASVAEALST